MKQFEIEYQIIEKIARKADLLMAQVSFEIGVKKLIESLNFDGVKGFEVIYKKIDQVVVFKTVSGITLDCFANGDSDFNFYYEY